MAEEMECMCLECGRSNYLGLDLIVLEDLEGTDVKVVNNQYCPECGGALMLRGKAGDEPFYRVE